MGGIERRSRVVCLSRGAGEGEGLPKHDEEPYRKAVHAAGGAFFGVPSRRGPEDVGVEPMSLGRVVILNGAPRAGKSTIAHALQARSDGNWMNIGVDRYLDMIPPHLRPGLGLRPGGERPDLEIWVAAMFEGLYATVAAHAGLGFDVVVDVGHHGRYLRLGPTIAYPVRRLRGLSVWWVGVRCPVPVIRERRRRTGYPVGDAAERWEEAVHDPGLYDLSVDTAALDAETAAEKILDRIRADEPRAMAEISGWLEEHESGARLSCVHVRTERSERGS